MGFDSSALCRADQLERFSCDARPRGWTSIVSTLPTFGAGAPNSGWGPAELRASRSPKGGISSGAGENPPTTERCCSSKVEHAHGKREGFSSILISSSGGRESTCFGGVSSDGHHAGILLVRGQPSKLCIARFDPEYPLRTVSRVREVCGSRLLIWIGSREQPRCYGSTCPCQGQSSGSIPDGCSSAAARSTRATRWLGSVGPAPMTRTQGANADCNPAEAVSSTARVSLRPLRNSARPLSRGSEVRPLVGALMSRSSRRLRKPGSRPGNAGSNPARDAMSPPMDSGLRLRTAEREFNSFRGRHLLSPTVWALRLRSAVAAVRLSTGALRASETAYTLGS